MSNRNGNVFIKNIANVITTLRIMFSIVMVIVSPFSLVFWICYISGGLSDLLDGIVARKLRRQSPAGARLDSVADLVFAIAIAVTAAMHIKFPVWLSICALVIALLRLTSYAIGFYKYRTFSSVHTYANKATGVLVFAFPILYAAFGLTLAGMLLSIAAFTSSLEELAITAKSQTLDRDRKGLFFRE